MNIKVCQSIAGLLLLPLAEVSCSVLPPFSKKPSIVFTLVDDLTRNRMKIMLGFFEDGGKTEQKKTELRKNKNDNGFLQG